MCELLTRMAHAPAQFFGSPPPGALGRGQKIYFSGHGHVEYQIKGDAQDTRSKGQLPLDFFESVGICDGATSNVF